jgi:glycosyltransferase involved in cell wall biosynthesis
MLPGVKLIFIPAWNEEDTVAAVVADVRAEIPDADVLVVDDGSTDRTAERAAAAGARVASLPFNLGLGAALQTGYRWAYQGGYEYCAHLDGDGQHPPVEVRRLLDQLVTGDADLMVGSRYHTPGEQMAGEYKATFTRRLGISIFGTLLTLTTRQRFTDITSGMRAGNRRAMELFADSYSPDFGEIESLQLALREGLKVEEMQARFLPREGGSSFLTPLRSAFFIFKNVIVLLVGQFKPRTGGVRSHEP